MSFVHLHCHSEYSLLDGMSKVSDLCRRVAEVGQSAVALTDHGWMAGAVKFVDAAKEAGIKPILGMEAYVVRGGKMSDDAAGPGDNYHLTLLAQNAEGYRNLMRLTTDAHLVGFHYKPRIDLTLLASRAEGVILLSGCIQGEVNQHIIADREKEARSLLRFYADTFGDRFFVEIMYHGLAPDGFDLVRNVTPQGSIEIEESDLVLWLSDYAERNGLPLVATNDAHYLTREDGDAHDTLLCLGMGAWKDKEDRMRYPGEQERIYEFYVKDEDEMRDSYLEGAFETWDHACDNTALVAEMVEPGVVPMGQLVMPAFQIPRDPGYTLWKAERTLL